MAKATQNNVSGSGHGEYSAVNSAILGRIVSAFKPDEIGLAKAWDEFYLACQAANASHELLRAIHDIKECIEDAEGRAV